MTTQQRAQLGWLGSPLRAGILTLALAGPLITGCVSPRKENTANVSPVAAQPLQTRQKIAQVMFAERCKTAGEKIHRTVENVDGVFLMKLRPNDFNYSDQFRKDDPYGHDSTGERYIIDFVGGFSRLAKDRDPNAPPHNGFRYVDAIDPKDGVRYRYTGAIKEVTHTTSVIMGGDGKAAFKSNEFVLNRVVAPNPMPRYGVTYDDISTREEREFWIAGSSLKVIDLTTNEIIGERIGYMVDLAQGSQAGGRSPWLFAANNACPGFQRNPFRPIKPGQGSAAQSGQTLDFVEKILKPVMKEVK